MPNDLQDVGERRHLAIEIEVGQRAALARLAFPDDGRLVAPWAARVAIDAVHARVQLPVGEPARVRRFPLEHLRERALPFELAGEACPEAFGVTRRFVVHRGVAHDRGGGEGRRRLEVPVFAQQRVDLGVMGSLGLIAHVTQHRPQRRAAAVDTAPSLPARHLVQRAGGGGTGGTTGGGGTSGGGPSGPGGGGTSFLNSSAPSSPPSVVNAPPTTSMNRNPMTRPTTRWPGPLAALEHLAEVRRQVARRVEEALGELTLPHAGDRLQRHVQDRPDHRADDAGEQAGERAIAERDRERLVLLHQPGREHAGRDEPQPAAAVPGAHDRQRRQHAEHQAGQQRGHHQLRGHVQAGSLDSESVRIHPHGATADSYTYRLPPAPRPTALAYRLRPTACADSTQS